LAVILRGFISVTGLRFELSTKSRGGKKSLDDELRFMALMEKTSVMEDFLSERYWLLAS
jgi:hypothetical protein